MTAWMFAGPQKLRLVCTAKIQSLLKLMLRIMILKSMSVLSSMLGSEDIFSPVAPGAYREVEAVGYV